MDGEGVRDDLGLFTGYVSIGIDSLLHPFSRILLLLDDQGHHLAHDREVARSRLGWLGRLGVRVGLGVEGTFNQFGSVSLADIDSHDLCVELADVRHTDDSIEFTGSGKHVFYQGVHLLDGLAFDPIRYLLGDVWVAGCACNGLGKFEYLPVIHLPCVLVSGGIG